MEKVLISVEDMATILKDAFESNCDCVSDEYCHMCSEMHSGCPVDDLEDCLHESIVEYRYFVLRHFKKFMVNKMENG